MIGRWSGPLATLVFAAACSVSQDPDDSVDGGSGGSTSSTTTGTTTSAGGGGAGGTAAGGTGGTGGAGGTAGMGGQGGTGVGGGSAGGGTGAGGSTTKCVSCAQHLQAPSAADDLCPGSATLYANVVGCTCAVCAAQCSAECLTQASPTPGCTSCQFTSYSGSCKAAHDACVADGP